MFNNDIVSLVAALRPRHIRHPHGGYVESRMFLFEMIAEKLPLRNRWFGYSINGTNPFACLFHIMCVAFGSERSVGSVSPLAPLPVTNVDITGTISTTEKCQPPANTRPNQNDITFYISNENGTAFHSDNCKCMEFFPSPRLLH